MTFTVMQSLGMVGGAMRGGGADANTRVMMLPSSMLLHVDARTEKQIMFSAASMLVHFAVAVLQCEDEEALIRSRESFDSQKPVSSEARKAATTAMGAATLSALFSQPKMKDSAEDGRINGLANAPTFCGDHVAASQPSTALEVLTREIRLLGGPDRRGLPQCVDGGEVSDAEAVSLLFFGRSSLPVCAPLSPSSSALLVFAALWLAAKLWGRTRITVSLNRILFDALEANTAAAGPAARGEVETAGSGEPAKARVQGLAGSATPPPEGLKGEGEGEEGLLLPLSQRSPVHDDALVLQVSQSSAPRGGGGVFGGFDVLQYVLQGVEEMEMVLLRCSNYLIPLPLV